MAEQMRPASKEHAPDPSHSYERSDPKRESGMGKLDAPKGTPHPQADGTSSAVSNQQKPDRQLNAQDTEDPEQERLPNQPDHSMKDEEPDGWDQAPLDIKDARKKRHPRTEGKGGTP